MFGSHFYHQRLRKAVAIFGALFNDINVIRKNSSGEVISQVKVPLSYAPRRDFLARMDQMSNGETNERQIALKLPRMSFEILALTYDANRQLPKLNNCFRAPESYNGAATKVYTPVPYDVGFQLSIYGKSQDDVLQIVEQILPYFSPQYTVTVKPFTEYDIKEDTPIVLTGISFSDDYEGPTEARRSIIYTLDFNMKINLYKSTGNPANVIESATVQVKDLDGNDLFDVNVVGNIFTNVSGTLLNEDGGIISETNFTVTNVRNVVTSMSIQSAPTNGTATATLTSTSLSSIGAHRAIGTWTYQPNADWHGNDSFVIRVTMSDGTYISQVITVLTANAVDDALDETVEINTALVSYIDINVGANDTFESTSAVYSLPAGSQAVHGTVTLIDSVNGIFRYTPDLGYTGTDGFVYRAKPSTGVVETATVTIIVS
jgi:hypothetical protein